MIAIGLCRCFKLSFYQKMLTSLETMDSTQSVLFPRTQETYFFHGHLVKSSISIPKIILCAILY